MVKAKGKIVTAELAPINRTQREIVRASALTMLFSEQPRARFFAFMPGGLGAGCGWFLGVGLGLHVLTSCRLLFSILCGLFAIVFFDWVGWQSVTRRSRPYLGCFNEEGRDEIERVA
jgi:hypothetical protein